MPRHGTEIPLSFGRKNVMGWVQKATHGAHPLAQQGDKREGKDSERLS
jgi:hypothetical protein